MLKNIAIVTVVVESLEITELVYQNELSYKLIHRGKVSDKMASGWDAKNVAGRPFILMGPTNNEAVYLRFIESEKFDKNFRSLKTYGWNAIEILVKDTEQLFLKLKDSQYFRIVGEPVYISDEKSIKAMQVLGPSNELIYFTSIEKPEKTGLTIEGASAEIDRIFIMILGVDNIESLRRYYSEKFNIITSDPAPFRIRTLSNEHGLPIETKYPLSIATLSEKSLIEIDEYPKASVYRENMANELPPGIAMVSFYVDSIPNTLPFISPVAADDELPYNKRKSAVIRGPVGELIEIIET